MRAIWIVALGLATGLTADPGVGVGGDDHLDAQLYIPRRVSRLGTPPARPASAFAPQGDAAGPASPFAPQAPASPFAGGTATPPTGGASPFSPGANGQPPGAWPAPEGSGWQRAETEVGPRAGAGGGPDVSGAFAKLQGMSPEQLGSFLDSIDPASLPGPLAAQLQTLRSMDPAQLKQIVGRIHPSMLPGAGAPPPAASGGPPPPGADLGAGGAGHLPADLGGLAGLAQLGNLKNLGALSKLGGQLGNLQGLLQGLGGQGGADATSIDQLAERVRSMTAGLSSPGDGGGVGGMTDALRETAGLLQSLTRGEGGLQIDPNQAKAALERMRAMQQRALEATRDPKTPEAALARDIARTGAALAPHLQSMSARLREVFERMKAPPPEAER